jgi:uncharacterized membrane protein YtjA (UPF0391 family)
MLRRTQKGRRLQLPGRIAPMRIAPGGFSAICLGFLTSVRRLHSDRFFIHVKTRSFKMLRAALAFFVIGLLAIVLGANNIAGISIDLGKTLLTVFVVLAVISFAVSLVTGRGTKHLG